MNIYIEYALLTFVEYSWYMCVTVGPARMGVGCPVCVLVYQTQRGTVYQLRIIRFGRLIYTVLK